MLWLILAGSVGSPQICIGGEPVAIRGEVEVRRPAVRLSDVFTGVPASIDRDIAQAPAPGKKMTYDINVLNRLAQKYRLDWQPQGYSDHVVVSSASNHISADVIRDAVVGKVKDAMGTLGKNKEIDVSFDNRSLAVDLPADSAPDFALNNFDYDQTSRRFRTDFVAQTARGPYTLAVLGRISIKQNVPVLTHRLEGGTIIGAADLDLVPVSEDRVNPTVLTDMSQLIGRELRRDTDEGELLHASDILPARLVKRGAIVTMKIETALMTVTSQGKTLQDGAEGDTVRVLNTQSNRMIEGTVTAPGIVTIRTTQKVAAVRERGEP